ncbi:hypothetical protein ADUPG1_006983 [Aduncisulcus paluster]|uniref:Uncharacterized protein n=1 Tax=Aduncisulcus paluster TaxID=2918883 RepID=A0ABQ5KK99_9EUKA|nr:hypothetical protein ADUPG1_006983 [Aduncisulcus paluster]
MYPHSTHSLRLLFQKNNHFHLYEDKALAFRRFGSIHSLSVIHTEDYLEHMLVWNSNNPTTAEWWPVNYVLDPWSDYMIADTDNDVTYGTSDIISRIKPSFQAPPIENGDLHHAFISTVKETDHLLEHDIGVLSVSRFK